MRTSPAGVLVLMVWTVPSGDLPAQADFPTLELAARFGCLECAGPHLFVSPQDIAVGEDGRIFVLDTEAPMVRVFDAAGAPQLTFGRSGRGPREFLLPVHIGVHADGSFHVVDARLYRVTYFERDGRELRSQTLPAFPLSATYSARDDVLLLASTDFRSATATISALDAPGTGPRKLLQLQPDFPRGGDGAPTHFFDLVAAPHGGFAVGAGTFDYRIRFHDAAGLATREFVRDVPRERRSPAEIQKERERWDRSRERSARMRAAEGGRAAARLEAVTIPDEKNHFNMRALAFDAHGRLWVRTQRGSVGTTFDIFDASGAYLGELRLPERVERFAFGRGMLAAIVLDEDQIAQVAVWRVNG